QTDKNHGHGRDATLERIESERIAGRLRKSPDPNQGRVLHARFGTDAFTLAGEADNKNPAEAGFFVLAT
ncbi:MAG: hypothetical protein RR836_16380, partial [Aeromonas sp.]|uniref:hypothetical protein n=1 Tax=Aeromonas sp. TaxID=647 RepID=UPI002FC79A42